MKCATCGHRAAEYEDDVALICYATNLAPTVVPVYLLDEEWPCSSWESEPCESTPATTSRITVTIVSVPT